VNFTSAAWNQTSDILLTIFTLPAFDGASLGEIKLWVLKLGHEQNIKADRRTSRDRNNEEDDDNDDGVTSYNNQNSY